MALRRKRDAIEELQCSVLVIQECAEADLAPYGEYRFKGPAQKGLAVITFDGWSIADSPDDPHLPGMIFVRILNPSGEHVADFGGVWALTGTERKYHEQFAQVLDFVRARTSPLPLVIAGDLNASAQGPSVVPHAVNVRSAAALGLVSVFHHVDRVEHGSESAMTLRWMGPVGTTVTSCLRRSCCATRQPALKSATGASGLSQGDRITCRSLRSLMSERAEMVRRL